MEIRLMKRSNLRLWITLAVMACVVFAEPPANTTQAMTARVIHNLKFDRFISLISMSLRIISSRIRIRLEVGIHQQGSRLTGVGHPDGTDLTDRIHPGRKRAVGGAEIECRHSADDGHRARLQAV